MNISIGGRLFFRKLENTAVIVLFQWQVKALFDEQSAADDLSVEWRRLTAHLHVQLAQAVVLRGIEACETDARRLDVVQILYAMGEKRNAEVLAGGNAGRRGGYFVV